MQRFGIHNPLPHGLGAREYLLRGQGHREHLAHGHGRHKHLLIGRCARRMVALCATTSRIATSRATTRCTATAHDHLQCRHSERNNPCTTTTRVTISRTSSPLVTPGDMAVADAAAMGDDRKRCGGCRARSSATHRFCREVGLTSLISQHSCVLTNGAATGLITLTSLRPSPTWRTTASALRLRPKPRCRRRFVVYKDAEEQNTSSRHQHGAPIRERHVVARGHGAICRRPAHGRTPI